MENTNITEMNYNENNLTSTKTDKTSLNSKTDCETLEENETSICLDDERKSRVTKLPISRIRTIIKADVENNLINQEALLLITKATELFMSALVKESYKYTHQSKKRTIQKHDIQNAVNNVNALIFLDGI